MQRKPVLQLTLAASLCTVALFASDFWKTKDAKEWSNEEVAKMLTDSPWAKQITVNSGQPAQRRNGGGRRGGMGGGFPGGGGGGYPGGGGGGYPGGGGGGYPGGSGGGSNGGYGGSSSQQIILRWESAPPVQQALLRQNPHSSDDQPKPAAADADQKFYVVAMLGFRMPSRRNDSDSSDDSDRKRDEELHSEYIDTAQLIPKSKIAIQAEDVKFEGRNGSTAIRFYFPRTFPLSKDDKEITFQFQSRGVKFEHKFKLSDMMYQEKLAL
jgi:hypothetical protein